MLKHAFAGRNTQQILISISHKMKLYTNYINEFSSLTEHFEDCCNRLPKFSKLFQDFERKDSCKHMKVKHYMLKPVQSLPQCRLLLEDYLKRLILWANKKKQKSFSTILHHYHCRTTSSVTKNQIHFCSLGKLSV